jgi:arylsulfatase A-like enzyme
MTPQYARRDFLRQAAFGAALLALGARMPRAHASTTRPNIVFIMADDLGYGDVGCYGSEKIRTPHMDALAKEGVRLTDAHSPSSVCTPTRYGVLTGRYAWRTRLKEGVLWSGYEPLLVEEGRPTVAAMLRDAGYRTGAIGKWHLGFTREEPADYSKRLEPGPDACGFDFSYLVPASHDMAPYCYINNGHVVGDFVGEKQVRYPQQREGLVTDDWDDHQIGPRLASEAVNFIARAAETPDAPFFLYFTPVAPHRPNQVAPFMQGKSDAGERGDHAQEFDWAVGEVVKALAAHGFAENTLLIVTSDNGARPAGVDGEKHGHKSCGDLRGYKTMIYEGGHRVPFIARWPGQIAPGTTSDAMVLLADLYATCAGILKVDLPENAAEDSFDMLPALTQGTQVRRDAVFHDVQGHFAIREGDWKLVLLKPETPALYNLAEDRVEAYDVAGEHPEQVAQLQALLESYKAAGRSRP